jgi:hypothetical protein
MSIAGALVAATALLGASTPAHAGPADAQMIYVGLGTFAPHKTIAHISQGLSITNLDARQVGTTRTHAFDVYNSGGTKVASITSVVFGETGSIAAPWSAQGLYTVKEATESGLPSAPDATVQVIA